MPLLTSGMSRLIMHRATSSRWLAGGIPAANCIAAYEPLGAVSLAASYANLANPGTYSAAPGTAPSFASGTGWTFAAASSQYLTTGITPASDHTWSIIVRFSGGTTSANSYLCGCRISTYRFYLNHSDGAAGHIYGHGGALTKSTALASGVMAMAASTAYLNGTSEGAITTGTGTLNQALVIGALNNAGTIAGFASVSIQRMYIYNFDFASYISALTTAINS